MFSGEALRRSHLQNIPKTIHVLNTYGPAEIGVTATVSSIDLDAADEPSIGESVGGVAWLVDPKTGGLASVSAIAELWLEGPSVSLGYLGQPEKTAASFVTDPEWLVRIGRPKGTRLYQTGDLVRYRPDLSLSFIGRKDSQVKIRGQRVELGEIEVNVRKLLGEHTTDELQVAVDVIASQTNQAGALTAFVGMPERPDLLENERQALLFDWTTGMKSKLGRILPTYMAPSAYVALGNMPLSTTGKIDRRRLRELGLTLQQQEPRSSPIAQKKQPTPSTKSEELLLGLWIEVLNILPETIALDESSFISLGGDSISAMQLVTRARRHGILVTVPEVLHAQSLRELAQRSKVVSEKTASAAPKLQHQDDDTAWPLSPIQRLFFGINPDGPNQFNQSIMLRLKSYIPPTKIAAAMYTIVARHEMLRARFHQTQEQGEWQQSVEPLGRSLEVFAFHEHIVADRHQMASVVQSTQEALDIQQGPVLAVDVICVPGQEQALLLTAHHLVIDIVSWQIIVYDMQQLFETGKLPQQLPPSFRSRCLLDIQLSEQLSSSHVPPHIYPPSATSFPYWGIGLDTNTYGNIINCELQFSARITSLLLKECNDAYRTMPIDILLAVLSLTFSRRFPDRPSPVVFVESHGRATSGDEAQDFSETVGWLTTMQPMQIVLDSSSTVFDAIKLSKDHRKSMEEHSRKHLMYKMPSEKNHGLLEVLFNFSGGAQQLEQADGLLTTEDRPHLLVPRSDVQSGARRFAVISIDAEIQAKQLKISFTINKATRHYTHIQDWIRAFETTLETTVLELTDKPFAPTLGDFPLLSITYTGLDRLLQDLWDEHHIVPASIKTICRTTPLQEGIILSTRKGSASYANSVVWRCRSQESSGMVSAEQLAQAWRVVFSRHSILSTLFLQHPETGRMLQVVLKHVNPRVVVRTTGSSDPSQYLRSRQEQHPSDTFEPSFAICYSAGGDVACRLDLSHAMSDALSFEILTRELITAYSEAVLPPAPPFAAFVAFIEERSGSSATSYWKTRLMDTVPSTFPSDKQRSDLSSHGTVPVALHDSQRVNSFCKQCGITRSVFIQIAYALVLSHYTHSSRVCFGYLASGRDTPIDGIEDLVGPLISMLVADIDLAQPSGTIFQAVKNRTIEDLSRQHVSLAEIMHDARPAVSQLFNTSVTVRTQRQHLTDTNNEIMLDVVSADDPHEYDLVLGAGLSGAATELAISFRKDILFESTAQGVANTLVLAIELLLSTNVSSEINPEQTLYNRFARTLQTNSTENALPKINGSFGYSGVQVANASHAASGSSSRHFKQQSGAENENVLRACCAEVLRIQDPNEIDMKASFLENGADSIQAMQLVAVLRERFVHSNTDVEAPH